MSSRTVGAFAVASFLFMVAFCPKIAFAQSTCSTSGLKGNYGFVGSGFVPQQLANHSGVRWDPISQIGAVNFDGDGKVKLTTRVQYQGKINPTLSISGTYTVNSDCTGTAAFSDSNDTVVVNWDFISVGGGEIETIEIAKATTARPMYSITFSQRRM